MSDTRISVLLVDDLPAVRHGLRLRLGLESDLLVVGEAADGKMALQLAAELAPDVIVMDMAMPLMDGVTATGALQRVAPRARIVMLDALRRSADTRAGPRSWGSRANRQA